MGLFDPLNTLAQYAGQVVAIDDDAPEPQLSGKLEQDYDASFLRECGIKP
jgi:hypothetical protein